ncbi:MAG: tetratricopeptide repeat protein [Methanothrix sp.]
MKIKRVGKKHITSGSWSIVAFVLLAMTTLLICALAQENTTDYWIDRADESMNNGSIEGAVSAYNEALKIDPENTTILIQEAFELSVLGRVNESSEKYESALYILDEKLKNDPNDSETWQWKATILERLNRQNESIEAHEISLEAFNKRIEKDSKDTDAWVGKGNALLNLGKWDEARDAYNRAIDIDPQNYYAWGRKAEVIGRTGDLNESMEAYEKTIELIPPGNTRELADCWRSKAEVLAYGGLSDDGRREDRLEDALTAINHSLELDPKSSSKWHFKATILSELGRNDEAIETFDEVLKQNPENADAWLRKAGLLVEIKRYNESLEAYDKAIELISENNAEDLALNWLSKGWALNKTGRTDEARAAFQMSLELYDRAISENLGDNLLLQQKGLALFELGRYDEAIEVYDQVLKTSLKVEPDTTAVSALIGKGDSLRLQGKNDDALEAYNKAIEVSPHYSNAWHGKGEAQKAMGQAYNASLSFVVADKLGYEE